ncbi:MAG: universal stress protein [Deltaproteobacteria bacterium]|nr:universal stress protein [Deltaproteobacteria bacterium]
MLKFTKILCPVDFDRNSAAALHFAYKLLDLGGILYLLHVIPKIQRFASEPYPSVIELAQQNLEHFARNEIGDQIVHELLVREGNPAGVTVHLAQELGAELIVMATHGHKGFVRIVLGSVAEQVLREARCPVLTLRPAPSTQPASA